MKAAFIFICIISSISCLQFRIHVQPNVTSELQQTGKQLNDPEHITANETISITFIGNVTKNETHPTTELAPKIIEKLLIFNIDLEMEKISNLACIFLTIVIVIILYRFKHAILASTIAIRNCVSAGLRNNNDENTHGQNSYRRNTDALEI